MQNISATFEQLIESNAVNEYSMSYHRAHGFLTALTICPTNIKIDTIREAILGEGAVLANQDTRTLDKTICLLTDEIDRSFNNEDGFTLSCKEEQSNFTATIEEWCIGFMEAHFLAVDAWFKEHEQEVCELFIPVMLVSGLFDDEPEFSEILQAPSLVEDMRSQIPEVLMELYLMFNSPEDARKKNVKSKV
ncbi:MAG: YecA family protein [Candidatus Endonucleobacter sp. (ex Gigantidas childressi)]|nr:YecA family protein [Candidatus Endonucleobacter sp. (ex Gigantidas childressi)]